MSALRNLDRIVSRVGNWWWFVGPILSVVLTWVSSCLAPIAHYGWAADVLCGMLIASLFMASIGAVLYGWGNIKLSMAKAVQSNQSDGGENSKTESQRDKENTQSHALRIEFDEDGGDASVQHDENGGLRRFLSFRICNDGNGYLTETKACLKATSPPLPDSKIRHMALPERLPRGEHRSIRLADYTESAPTKGHVPDRIILGWVTGGLTTLNEMPAFDASLAPISATIEATASQCLPCQKTFRIWIDPALNKLRAQII